MTGRAGPVGEIEEVAAEAGALIETPAGRVDRYGVALVLISMTIALNVLVPSGPLAGIVVVALGSATLVFCLTASDAKPRVVLVVRALAIFAVAVTVVASVAGDVHIALVAVAVTGAALAFVAPVAIGSRLIRQPIITQHTVLGALCLYLLAGLFFSYVYLGIDALDPPVFAQVADATPSETTYFSFVTLATLGYGDFSPAGPTGRLVAITEAVGAQIFLVTIVAVLVTNIGRRRER